MKNQDATPKPKTPAELSCTELLAAVLEWIHANHSESAAENDTTETLGLDSLDHVEIAIHVKEKTFRDIPDEWLERLNEKSTLKEWASEVAKHASS
jgi:acyl carrier protein